MTDDPATGPSRYPSGCPTVPRGSCRSGSTGADLAAAIGPRLAQAAIAVLVNGAERDLSRRLARRCERQRHYGGLGCRPGNPAPLDGPCDGPGRDTALAGGQVRHRAGHRRWLLLRLRFARRGSFLAERTSPASKRPCARSWPRTSLSSARSIRSRGPRDFRRPALQREIIERVDAAQPEQADHAGIDRAEHGSQDDRSRRGRSRNRSDRARAPGRPV